MAQWTYLLQLLGVFLQAQATFQMLVSSTQNHLKFNITFDKCPQKWTITDMGAKAVLMCWKKNNKIKLMVRALPRRCAGEDDSTCPYLNITINSLSLEIETEPKNLDLSKEHTLCKTCRWRSRPSRTNCNNLDCKEKLLLTAGTLAAAVQFKGSNGQKVIESVDNKTGNSLTFHNETKSWIKALQHCRNLNSTLVQITNLTVEEEEVVNLLEEKTELQNGVWIGLERSIFGTDIDWKWVSGISGEYLGWNSSFPVDPLNNHCGKVIWVESQDIQLLDGNCHEKLPFICQGVK